MRMIITEDWLRAQLALVDDVKGAAGMGCLLCTMERMTDKADHLFNVAREIVAKGEPFVPNNLLHADEHTPARCTCGGKHA